MNCLYWPSCDNTLFYPPDNHGRRSREGRGTSPPQNLERGDANTNCPPRFCHIGTKMSVLWPSKYAKIRFRLGLCSRRSPRLLSRLERGHPSAYPTPLGTDPPSALAMRPPRSPARSTSMQTIITAQMLSIGGEET